MCELIRLLLNIKFCFLIKTVSQILNYFLFLLKINQILIDYHVFINCQ